MSRAYMMVSLQDDLQSRNKTVHWTVLFFTITLPREIFHGPRVRFMETTLHFLLQNPLFHVKMSVIMCWRETMDDEKVKFQIGANIAAYRKNAGLTQAGLAEKLNYSDKAGSVGSPFQMC